MEPVTIIGGGLAGCEAAWQVVQRGGSVRLIDMKPAKKSPAHQSDRLAELVCSNSLRSADPTSAVGLLKQEMAALGSLFIEAAQATAVPAGRALAVNRDEFSAFITARLSAHPKIEIVTEEVTAIPAAAASPIILASGPLTSDRLAEALAAFTGRNRLAFYDAIAPIVYYDSLDFSIVYRKSRWEDGPGDYLNCPLDKEQYTRFITELAAARYVPLKAFEDERYFEGCLPIEVMRSRGDDTLRFGPMKPVGLEKPDGTEAYAVVQLRSENRAGTTWNMVGFQTRLTYPEQKRIFRMIPGMEKAEFARLGSIHRNTFLVAPELLRPTLQFQQRQDLLLAGQLSGVEGYVESAAMGLLAGINAARLVFDIAPTTPPADTAFGALVHHLTATAAKHFQPSNVNFGLFPAWENKVPKKFRGRERAKRSAAAMKRWLDEINDHGAEGQTA